MNQKRMTHRVGRVLALLLVTPPLVLGACKSDPVGVVSGGDRYLDEIFEIATETDVQYGAALDENEIEERLLLDLFQPNGDEALLRPAVIWLHGGSFRRGHKGEVGELARSSARRGFVSVSANYRLRETSEFDYTDPNDAMGEAAKHDAQHDALAVVRWVRANAVQLRIDTDLIFFAGYSAGGTAALRAAASPEDPGTGGNAEQPSNVAGAVAISTSLDPGVLASFDRSKLLIHGTADTKVPLARVQEECAAVASCQLFAIDGAAHDMIDTAREAILAEVVRFLHAEVTAP